MANQLTARKEKVVFAEWKDSLALLEDVARKRGYGDTPGQEGGVARLLREITAQFLSGEFPGFEVTHPVYIGTKSLARLRTGTKPTLITRERMILRHDEN